MIATRELQRWLETLKPGTNVAISEEGLVLTCHEDPRIYLEVGGHLDEEEVPVDSDDFEPRNQISEVIKASTPPRTWTELLGKYDRTFIVDGCDIVQLVSTGGKFVVRWHFETREMARRCFEAWKREQ